LHIVKITASHFFLFLIIAINSASAADISRDVRGADAQSGSFVELGFHLGLERVAIAGYNSGSDTRSEVDEAGGELGIFLNTRLEWNGLFVELFNESFALATFGYNAWGNDSVEFDLILTSTLGELDPGVVTGFETLNVRDAAVEGGIRTIVYDTRL